MSKPRVAYYTKMLEKVGFIRREKRSKETPGNNVYHMYFLYVLGLGLGVRW